MARTKSQKHKDMSVYILRALQESSEIDGKDFSIGDGGTVIFTRNGEQCKIKFSTISGPREHNKDILDVL